MRPHTPASLTLFLAAALIAGCGDFGRATPAPPSVAPSTRATPTPSPSRAPRPTPTPIVTPAPVLRSFAADVGCQQIRKPQPPSLSSDERFVLATPKPKIVHPNTASAAALRAAAAKLRGLRSYQFQVEFYGRDVRELQPTTLDIGLQATVTHVHGLAMDGVFGFQMREFDNSASTGSSSRLVVGANNVWSTGQVSGDLEPARGFGQAASWATLSGEAVADRLITPFGGGFRRVADELHAGVRSRHYVATAGGVAAYASAMHFPPKGVTADAWIAIAGGHLVGARIRGTPAQQASGNNVADQFEVELEVSHPNAAGNEVRLPVPPVPNPIRLGDTPVDLRLEYVVEPPSGLYPTDEELNAMAVTLRRRLGVSTRQMAVDIVAPATLVVTLCGTTTAEGDRVASAANGALGIVPLPFVDYGSTEKSGPHALPLPGSEIDPALRSITDPGRAAQTEYHVDPRTGERGVAFVLQNDDAGIWRAYAALHDGEYVAIVLDDTILATLPIDARVAKGTFVFTGDYTEAEARLLAERLYTDPLPFPHRLVSDIEAPAALP